MLICSVCRSQNTDTAKFCGSCGNPFPRPSASTSSLVNCAQGHIYSAVYPSCPYCPHTTKGPASEFATSVADLESNITRFDPSIPATMIPTLLPEDGFATHSEPKESALEPAEPAFAFNSLASASTTLQTPVITPASEHLPEAVSKGLPNHLSGVSAGALSNGSSHELLDELEGLKEGSEIHYIDPPSGLETNSEPDPGTETFIESLGQNQSLYQAVPMSDIDQPEARESGRLNQVDLDQAGLDQAGLDQVDLNQAGLDRHTIFVAEQISAGRSSKGRIVGWLISYSHNPDGDDYRIHAGYNRIGANPVCDITLEDETVSGSHAIIVYRDGRCLLKDDLSRNGTFVNGREIGEAHPLQSYDQIRIGNTYLTFIAAQRVA